MMENYGITLGWITGMMIQIIFFPMLIHKNTATNHAWWTVQLIGLFITIVIWFYLDRRVIKAWLSKIDWNKIIEWWKS